MFVRRRVSVTLLLVFVVCPCDFDASLCRLSGIGACEVERHLDEALMWHIYERYTQRDFLLESGEKVTP